MLSLRLTRGARPSVLLRRSLVTVAAAGASFLLLSALGFASGHPADSQGAVGRLLWCLVPLAATVHLAVAVGRADPSTGPGPGFAAVGLGPARAALLAAVSMAAACALGGVLALLVFLYLRGDLGSWLDWAGSGAVGRQLGSGRPLPLAGTVTLLAVVPVLVGAACAAVLWPRQPRAGHQPPRQPRGARRPAVPAPPTVVTGPVAPLPHRTTSGLPWGIALTAAGLALQAYASGDAPPHPDALLAVPGRLGGNPPGVVGGWALAALGLVLAGPGLTHLCGRLLAVGRPGVLRLLAGRMLQQEAGLIGRPVGALCALAAAGYTVLELYGRASGPSGAHAFGPLTGLGAALVTLCAAATTLTAVVEARNARERTTAALLRLGAPTRLLRGAAALRATALLALLVPLVWVVAHLTAMPFHR
ncbi:hypothetical protein ADL28_14915 [Streptomyces violaceusniger]|uniref:Integral membrane protein n=2 Tax=Streptomyces violaceusniger group TaxID=2839105 RepID=A0ABD5J9N9_9ACTN|nr:hypothetical protein [Streptomyces violaceusniger]KUL62033.1 hypothetical protein ADL28_14915 [Streptomyces violaceusniger]MEE4585095.1 hypothetical protein [Streptomyces sp. DSM 41602]